jgi:hypothetical protein
MYIMYAATNINGWLLCMGQFAASHYVYNYIYILVRVQTRMVGIMKANYTGSLGWVLQYFDIWLF